MRPGFHSDILHIGAEDSAALAPTTEPQIRTAIVGLGGIASAHLRKLEWMPEVRIVAVCDRADSLADAVAERHGVGPVFTDAEEMLAQVQADVVHVLTPPQSHRDIVLAALAHGAHVFVEKPISTCWADYVEMRNAAAAAGRLLVENYNYRFVDVVLEAIARQRDGAVGETVTVDVSMTVGLAEPGAYTDRMRRHFGHDLPGGALFNFASHPASFVAALMSGFDAVGVWRGRLGSDALSDDELRAVVGRERCAATITLTSRARPSSFTVMVRGTDGVLEVDVYNRRLFHSPAGPGVQRLTEGFRHGFNELSGAASLAARYATARHDYFVGLGTLLQEFYGAVAGRRPTPVAASEMDTTNALLHALFDPENAI